MRFLQVHFDSVVHFLFDMTLSLLWPVISVCTTCSIYKEHSSMTVVTSRHFSVVWGVVLWNGCRTWEAVPVLPALHPSRAWSGP